MIMSQHNFIFAQRIKLRKNNHLNNMKVVIQKVKNASVTVEGKVISSIGKGLMILVGISTSDGSEEIGQMSRKISNLRLFEDTSAESGAKTAWAGKPWSKSVMDNQEWQILCVSQFTLYGNIKKGTKPDFHRAAKGETAKNLYNEFLGLLKTAIGEDRVKDGEFGAMMDVLLVNDGPVTIVYDTLDK